MHLSPVASIVGRAIPVKGVKLVSLDKKMQVILAVGDVAAVEHHGSALAEIEGSAALDQVLAYEITSIIIARLEVMEDVDGRATNGRSGHVFSLML